MACKEIILCIIIGNWQVDIRFQLGPTVYKIIVSTFLLVPFMENRYFGPDIQTLKYLLHY